MDVSDALLKIAFFSKEEIETIIKELKPISFRKGDCILKKGDVCQSAYFIQKGAVYQYVPGESNDLVIDLHATGDWVLNQASFIAQKPSKYEIRCFEQVDLMELSVHSIHALIQRSSKFFILGKILEQGGERAMFFDQTHSPAEKYKYIFEKRPALLQKFPLKMIASYLKITPETLSRVRSAFTK